MYSLLNKPIRSLYLWRVKLFAAAPSFIYFLIAYFWWKAVSHLTADDKLSLNDSWWPSCPLGQLMKRAVPYMTLDKLFQIWQLTSCSECDSSQAVPNMTADQHVLLASPMLVLAHPWLLERPRTFCSTSASPFFFIVLCSRYLVLILKTIAVIAFEILERNLDASV